MNISLLKNLTDPKFSLGNIKFQIIKLSPMAGFNLSEKIRFALTLAADSAEAIEDLPSMDRNIPAQKKAEIRAAILFCKAILKLPPPTIEDFRNTLFENIEFTGGDVAQGWVKLKGMEDMAFTEPLQIYEVLVRSLIVNFTGSFRELMQRFPAAMQNIL